MAEWYTKGHEVAKKWFCELRSNYFLATFAMHYCAQMVASILNGKQLKYLSSGIRRLSVKRKIKQFMLLAIEAIELLCVRMFYKNEIWFLYGRLTLCTLTLDICYKAKMTTLYCKSMWTPDTHMCLNIEHPISDFLPICCYNILHCCEGFPLDFGLWLCGFVFIQLQEY